MTRLLGRTLAGVVLVLLAMLAGSASAQLEDEAPFSIPADEALRLRALLETPIDPSLQARAQRAAFREKDLAARRLGDRAARERNLREYARIAPDFGGIALMTYLGGTEKRDEAYEIGNGLIAAGASPATAVRARARLAEFRIQDGRFAQAFALLEQAQAIAGAPPLADGRGASTARGRGAGRVERASRAERGAGRRANVPAPMLLAQVELLTARAHYAMETGHWNDAIDLAELAVDRARALVDAERVGDELFRHSAQENLLDAMLYLAWCRQTAGRFAGADEVLAQALRLAREWGMGESETWKAFNRVADLYNAIGRYGAALDAARRSEAAIASQGYGPGTQRWLYAQRRINLALAGAGRYGDALANLQRMTRELRKAGRGPETIGQGSVRAYVFLRAGRTADALQVLDGALKGYEAQGERRGFVVALLRGLRAVALAESSDPAAGAEFERAVAELTAPATLTGDVVPDAFERDVRRFVLESYARWLARAAPRDARSAEALFRLADALGGSSVQLAISEAAVRMGTREPALAETMRREQEARHEVAMLNRAVDDDEDAVPRDPRLAEERRRRVRELDATRRELRARIEKEFPDYYRLVRPQPPGVADVARELAGDELFVSIVPTDFGTFVWAVDANAGSWFVQSPLASRDLASSVERLRETLDVAELGETAPTFDYATSHALYDALLGPLAPALAGKRHVVVAASGALARLPFAVLTVAPLERSGERQPPWLVRDVAISNVPGASAWVALRARSKRRAGAEPLIAWGDPAFDAREDDAAGGSPRPAVRATARSRAAAAADAQSEGIVDYRRLPRLPDTRDEVIELARILGANPGSDVMLGAAATRASVLESSANGVLGRKRVVAFATHGLLPGDLPGLDQPALAMASIDDEAGSALLTLEDVLTLKLDADWVVLSACNTAGADGRAEEALSGLARGFFFSGARSLLVTHWAVESRSATRLTTGTFTAYREQPGLRRAEALRAAMLRTMQDPRFAHPAYWAPFALVGEGGR